jgi:hypothetical protein
MKILLNMNPSELLDQQIAEQKDIAIQALAYARELEKTKEKTKDSRGMEQWLDFTFCSSSGLTEEFDSFSRQMKKHLKSVCGSNIELVNYSRGHFEFSAFCRNKTTGKFVYIHSSDVRFFPNSWHNDLLVRTAQHEKDYTGGSNYSCTLAQLPEKLQELTV